MVSVKRLERYRNIVLWTNFLYMLVGVGIVVLALLFILGVDFLRTFIINGPDFFYFGVGIVGLAICFLSFFGILAVLRRKKDVLLCYTFFTVILVIVELILAIFLLLYANNVSTIPALDDFAGQIQDDLESSLVAYAEDPSNQEDWRLIQDALDCCGVDFESTYLYPEFNKSLTEFLNSQLSGEGCADAYSEIILVHANFSEYNETAEEQLLELLGSPTYFCKDRIREFTQQATLFLGIAIALVVLLQKLTVFSSYMLLCTNPKEKHDDEDNAFYHESFVEGTQQLQSTLSRKKKVTLNPENTGLGTGPPPQRPPPPINTSDVPQPNTYTVSNMERPHGEKYDVEF